MYHLLKNLDKRGRERAPRVVAIEAMRQIKSWADTIGNGWKARAEVIRYANRRDAANRTRILEVQGSDGATLPGDTVEDWKQMRDYAIVIGELAAELERYTNEQIARLTDHG